MVSGDDDPRPAIATIPPTTAIFFNIVFLQLGFVAKSGAVSGSPSSVTRPFAGLISTVRCHCSGSSAAMFGLGSDIGRQGDQSQPKLDPLVACRSGQRRWPWFRHDHHARTDPIVLSRSSWAGRPRAYRLGRSDGHAVRPRLWPVRSSRPPTARSDWRGSSRPPRGRSPWSRPSARRTERWNPASAGDPA